MSLKRISSCLLSLGVALCLSCIAGTSLGAGLYLNLPTWFQPADTSGTELVASETWFESGWSDAIVLGVEVRFNPGRRTSVKLGIIYPAIHKDGGFRHGFGDGFISSTTRVSGDSLNTDGLFLRWDIRIPTGSGAMEPFGFRRDDGGVYPDAGAGFEYRKKTSFCVLRGSATWTKVGQGQVKGDFVNGDYLLAGLGLGISAGRYTTVHGTVFGIDFDGRGYRECYLFGLTQVLSGGMDMTLTCGVERGNDDERVFDSSVSVIFTSRFPVADAAGEGD